MQSYSELETNFKGGKDVQEKNKEDVVKLVRTLDEVVRKNFLIADKKVYVHAIKILSDNDSKISVSLLNSLLIHLSLFVPDKIKIMLPPWIDHLKNNKGLRNFSKEYAGSTSDLFKIFGLKRYGEISKSYINCPHYAYSLGEYELAEKLITVPRLDYLEERIHLQCHEEVSEDFFEKTTKIKNNDINTIALNSYLMLKLFRLKDLRYKKIQKRITNYIQSLGQNKREQKTKTHIQVLNSINFIYLNTDIKKMHDTLDLIETIFDADLELKTLYRGNLLFQKATIAEKEGNSEAQLNYLLKSNELDPLFHTVLFKLAMIFHDKNEFENAKIYYEQALAISPLNINLINDYGICLNQMNSKEAKTLSRIINEFKIETMPNEK